METKKENVEYTKEQVYVKYCLQAKSILESESLKKKNKPLWVYCFIALGLMVLCVLFIVFLGRNIIVICISIVAAITLLTTNIIILMKKPDEIEFVEIFKKADDFIENKRNNMKKNMENSQKELEILNKL